MVSRRATEIEPFIVMGVLERVQALEREGRDIVHMEVGEPDFDAPPAVVEAMTRAVRDGKTHYTHSLGIWELREAIASLQMGDTAVLHIQRQGALVYVPLEIQ